MHIVTLATTFNRKNKTIRCLQSLHNAELPEGVTISHNIVIDGSTDGTAETIKNDFPGVNLIMGTGELYWAGGMRFGWQNLLKDKQMDYLFVYNDDVVFDRQCIVRLLRANEGLSRVPHVIVGSFIDSNGNCSYGGRRSRSTWHPLNTEVVVPSEFNQEVDTLNMNGALISSKAIEKIGFLSENFLHSQADFDYGLRLRRSSGRIILCPGYIGQCEKNLIDGTSLEPAVSLFTRIRRLSSIKEQPPRQLYHLYKEYKIWPLLILIPYARLIYLRFREKVSLDAK